MKPAILSSFIVITQTLLNHVVTADLQIYRIECMRNLEPHCCEVQCDWQKENIIEDGVCEVFGNYMKCEFEKGPRNLTTPLKLGRRIDSTARCKIHKKKQDLYTMSCYHDGKPICCDTPCKCDLNLLSATCTMQEKSMECSCAESGSGDNPVLNFCFKNTCLHKTNKTGCDFTAGDTCYISTEGVTDGKGQEQKSKQDKKEMKKDNVTPKPVNNNEGPSFGLWIFISGIFLGILISWMYCYVTRKYSICGSCCENQKKLDHKRKGSSSEDKDKESETTDDEGQAEIKQEVQQHKKLDRVQYVRQRVSSTSGSEAEPSGSVKCNFSPTQEI